MVPIHHHGVYKIAHSARQFGRKLDCHARHLSQWECQLIKALGHVSTLSFSCRCRVGGEPDLRCGACAIHRTCAEPDVGTRGGDFRNPKLIARMGRQGIFPHQLAGNLPRQDLIDTKLKLARTIGDDGPIVLAVRDAEIPGGGFAEMLLQKGERLRSEIRARLYPEPLHPCRGDGSDPVKFGDRQGCEELVVGDARRGRQANVLEDAGANLLGGRRGGREAAPVLRDIEIGLIERQRLDQRIAVVDGMAERTPKARAS
jgi:hypothetical protein